MLAISDTDVAQWDALVASLVPRYSRQSYRLRIEDDDIRCYARAGVLKGLRTFDSEKGVKLSSWVYACANNAVLEGIRDASKSLGVPRGSSASLYVNYDPESHGEPADPQSIEPFLEIEKGLDFDISELRRALNAKETVVLDGICA